MSAPFSTDFSDNLKTYVTDPSKQLNLGYSVISFWYVAAFFLGLFFVSAAFIAMVFKKNYREGNDSKRPLVILIWVGFGLMVFGIWSSISSFYTIVSRINSNVRVNKECSLFMPESAQSAVDVLASSSLLTQNVNEVVEKRRQALMGSRGVSDEYGLPDSRSSLVYSGTDAIKPAETISKATEKPTDAGAPASGPSGFAGPFGPRGLFGPSVVPTTASQSIDSSTLHEKFKSITDPAQIEQILTKVLPTLSESDDPERYLRYLYRRGQELGLSTDSKILEYIKSLVSE